MRINFQCLIFTEFSIFIVSPNIPHSTFNIAFSPHASHSFPHSFSIQHSTSNIVFHFIFYLPSQFATIEPQKGGPMNIGEIMKGKDKIIITAKEFKGKQYIDIRTYFENDSGEWIPTKKGISLTPDNLDEMIAFLQKAKKQTTDNSQ